MSGAGGLPVVDLAPALAAGASRSAVAGVATALGDAVARVGFALVVGHGVPGAVLDDAYTAAERYTALDPQRAAGLASPTGHPFRGHVELRSPDGVPTVRRFQLCDVPDAGAARSLGVEERWLGYFHPNVWPEPVDVGDDFRPAIERCFAATVALGDRIMDLFGVALGFEPGAGPFPPAARGGVSCFAVNRYDGLVGGGTTLFPAHTDSGTLTLLHQRGDDEGLEVELVDGRRTRVPIREDAFVVNVGELMRRWTNGRWRATPHCVVGPPAPGPSRTSLVTFHLPPVDTVVAPLAELLAPREAPAFDPVSVHDWEGRFLAGLLDDSTPASAATSTPTGRTGG